ncbi:MAG: 16S rRNA (uracil(1498)-N(3))-methyltransferase [Mariprofundaceae bacterium]
MRLSRLFADVHLASGMDVHLSSEHGHYLRQVLRLRKSGHLVLFDGSGGEYHAEITLLSKQACTCHVLSFDAVNRELSTPVHIIQAACRSDKVDTVLQKCTELGAASFQIVTSDRATLRLSASKLDIRLSRWRKIIIEAAEQSGRTRVPKIVWRSSLADIQAGEGRFVMNPEATIRWPDARQLIVNAPSIYLATGPEGGWSIRDLEQWHQLGFKCLGFGNRILRTETATPALLSAIQSIMD